MFRLNSTTGQLIPLSPESSIPTLGSPFALSIDPSGKHLYATITGDIESNVVSMFNIDPKTGLLTPLAPQSIPYIGTFALNMLINPLSGFLYLDTMTGSLSMFSIESATGILSPLTPPSINTASFCIGLTLSPNAKFMYNSCIDGSIIGYTIESNGLAEVSFMLNLQKGLSGATINQSGSILYTLDVYNNEALMFAISSESGDLTQLNPQIKISTQRTPLSIRLNKTNDFAYVTNLDSNSISMYSVEKDSGILIPLSPESSIATGTGPWDISFDPSEKFAYVTNANESTLSAYSVNQVTGELTPLAESSIPTGEGARIIVFN
jgi:6-phosphogluconolactonase (cycloisomerase 2 family)